MTEPAFGVGRSLSGRRWVWRTGEDRVAFGIAQRMGVPEIVGRLLAARGIGVEAACDFLEPTLRVLLPDPSVLADMDVAADRLARAALAGETVGVFGDERTYDYVIALRIVESTDAMTADWAKLPFDLLQKISSRITNEVRGVSRVVLDISSKPPSTIEWE